MRPIGLLSTALAFGSSTLRHSAGWFWGAEVAPPAIARLSDTRWAERSDALPAEIHWAAEASYTLKAHEVAKEIPLFLMQFAPDGAVAYLWLARLGSGSALLGGIKRYSFSEENPHFKAPPALLKASDFSTSAISTYVNSQEIKPLRAPKTNDETSLFAAMLRLRRLTEASWQSLTIFDASTTGSPIFRILGSLPLEAQPYYMFVVDAGTFRNLQQHRPLRRHGPGIVLIGYDGHLVSNFQLSVRALQRLRLSL